jgi:putative flippase GtrA
MTSVSPAAYLSMRENAEPFPVHAQGGMRREAVRFAVVGTACVLLNAGLFEVLVQRQRWNYLAVTVLAFFAVNSLGFLLHRRWTFRATRSPSPPQAARFFSIQTANLGLTLLLMWLLVGKVAMNSVLASIVVSLLFAASSFLAQRLWTFRAESI